MLIAVMSMLAAAFALVPTLSLHFTFAFMILIVALILRIVFPRSYEVHRPIAGIVFMAMPAPIFCVTRGDVQINRRWGCVLRLDQHGLCVDDRRRTLVADIDLTIHAGDDLPRQHDAEVHSARMTCTDAGAEQR
jgi:hypothetical protein